MLEVTVLHDFYTLLSNLLLLVTTLNCLATCYTDLFERSLDCLFVWLSIWSEFRNGA